jgi:hypothetical protein
MRSYINFLQDHFAKWGLQGTADLGRVWAVNHADDRPMPTSEGGEREDVR